MKGEYLIVLGSGGSQCIPKALCYCEVCSLARKNPNYIRRGPCVYFPKIDILVDTPLQINENLEFLKKFPKKIFYSHWHPDHMEG